MESGRNMAFGTPFINKEGTNTARILNRIKSFGKAISLVASAMARALVLPISR
jgi:hypothetical protein